jgi:hypothetical protein
LDILEAAITAKSANVAKILIAAGLSPLAPQHAAIAAARIMLAEFTRLSAQRLDFAFESTLSVRRRKNCSTPLIQDELRMREFARAIPPGGWPGYTAHQFQTS